MCLVLYRMLSKLFCFDDLEYKIFIYFYTLQLGRHCLFYTVESR